MTAEEAIFRIEECTYSIMKGNPKDYQCNSKEQLTFKMICEIKHLCDNYKEIK